MWCDHVDQVLFVYLRTENLAPHHVEYRRKKDGRQTEGDIGKQINRKMERLTYKQTYCQLN